MVLCVCKCIFTLHAQKTQENQISNGLRPLILKETHLWTFFWYFEFQKKKKRRAEGVIFCSSFEVFGAVISGFWKSGWDQLSVLYPPLFVSTWVRDLVNLNFKRDKNETVGGDFKAPNEWCRLIKNVVFFFLTPFDLNIKLRLFIYTASSRREDRSRVEKLWVTLNPSLWRSKDPESVVFLCSVHAPPPHHCTSLSL